MKEYVTTSGDTWDLISYNVYGNYNQVGPLLKANPKHASTVIFSGGIILKIPQEEISKSSKLPPWKRGM